MILRDYKTYPSGHETALPSGRKINHIREAPLLIMHTTRAKNKKPGSGARNYCVETHSALTEEAEEHRDRGRNRESVRARGTEGEKGNRLYIIRHTPHDFYMFSSPMTSCSRSQNINCPPGLKPRTEEECARTQSYRAAKAGLKAVVVITYHSTDRNFASTIIS